MVCESQTQSDLEPAGWGWQREGKIQSQLCHLTSCVTIDKLLNLSEPKFPYLGNIDNSRVVGGLK